MKKQDRNKLIRLAHKKPELREQIIGLIKKQAAFKFIQDGELDGLSFDKIEELAEKKFGQGFDQVDIASIRKVNGKIRITASVRVDIGAGSNEVAEVAREYGIGLLAPDDSGASAPELSSSDATVNIAEVQDTPFPTRETVRNVVVVRPNSSGIDNDRSEALTRAMSGVAPISIALPSRTRTTFRSRARTLPFVQSVMRGTQHPSTTHSGKIDGVKVSITVEGNTPEERAADAYQKFLKLKREFPDASLVTDFYIEGDTLFIIIADAQVPEDTSAIAEARSSFNTIQSMSGGSGGSSSGGGSSYSDRLEPNFFPDEDSEEEDSEDYESYREEQEREERRQRRERDQITLENEWLEREREEAEAEAEAEQQRQEEEAAQALAEAPAKGDYVMLDGSSIPNAVFLQGYIDGLLLARRNRQVQEHYGTDREGNSIPASKIFKWNYDSARGWRDRIFSGNPDKELSKAQRDALNGSLGYRKPKAQRSGIANPFFLKGIYTAIVNHDGVDLRSIPSKSKFMKTFGFSEGFQGQNSTESYAHRVHARRTAKMASSETRQKLIRLAYEKPELRSKIIPLLETKVAYDEEKKIDALLKAKTLSIGRWGLFYVTKVDKNDNMYLKNLSNKEYVLTPMLGGAQMGGHGRTRMRLTNLDYSQITVID